MSDDESSVLSDRGTNSPQPLSMASAAVPVQEEAPAQQETPAQDGEPSNDYSEESQFEQFKHELPRAYLAAAKTSYPHIPREGVKPVEYPTLVSAKAVGKSLLSNIENLSAAELYNKIANSVDILVDWQDEWHEHEKTQYDLNVKDGVADAKLRNPLKPDGKQKEYVATQDMIEADAYGYERNPHHLKIGMQDPIAQRSGAVPGRHLRARNPTHKAIEAGLNTPDVDGIASQGGRVTRHRGNASQVNSQSRGPTPLPATTRKAPKSRVEALKAEHGDSSSDPSPDQPKPKNKGGRPSKKMLEERARLAEEARAQEEREAAEKASVARDSPTDTSTQQDSRPTTSDSARTRSATAAAQEPSVAPEASDVEETQPTKKPRTGRSASKKAESAAPEAGAGSDRGAKLRAAQLASWEKDDGARKKAQSDKMKLYWKLKREREAQANSLAGSTAKKSDIDMSHSSNSTDPKASESKAGQPNFDMYRFTGVSVNKDSGRIIFKFNTKKRSREEADLDSATPDVVEPRVKRKRRTKEEMAKARLEAAASTQETTGARKNRGGRPRKHPLSDVVAMESESEEPPPTRGGQAKKATSPAPFTKEDNQTKRKRDLHDDGDGGLPAKRPRAKTTATTPLAPPESEYRDSDDEALAEEPVQPPKKKKARRELSEQAKKEKSDKMSNIMKAERWASGKMSHVGANKKAKTAEKKAKQASTAAPVAEQAPPDPPAPKITEYEAFLAASSPNMQSEKRKKRPAALKASSSFSKVNRTEDEEEHAGALERQIGAEAEASQAAEPAGRGKRRRKMAGGFAEAMRIEKGEEPDYDM